MEDKPQPKQDGERSLPPPGMQVALGFDPDACPVVALAISDFEEKARFKSDFENIGWKVIIISSFRDELDLLQSVDSSAEGAPNFLIADSPSSLNALKNLEEFPAKAKVFCLVNDRLEKHEPSRAGAEFIIVRSLADNVLHFPIIRIFKPKS